MKSLFCVISFASPVLCVSAWSQENTVKAPFPADTLSAVGSVSAGANTTSSSVGRSHVSESMGILAYQHNFPVGHGFYISPGFRLSDYAFSHSGSPLVSNLREVSALLAVEYVVDGEAVAAIELHPGAYYEKHIESNDWDIPFDVYSGVPISKSLNGVIGGYFGRFVKHPIPIIGLIYQLNPQWRFEAIYPEPSINYKYNSRVSLKLGGELLGNGYRTSSSSDSGHLRTKLEFFDYRVGLHVITELNNISRLTIGAGYSVQRVFNFFDAHQEVHLKPAPFFKVGLEVNWPSNPR